MKNKNLSPADYQIFLLKSLLWLGAGWLGFFLALAGFFYAAIVWIFFILGAIWTTRYVLKNKLLSKISLELWIVSIIFILVTVLFSIFSTPTVFSGRDQGAISEAAIRLAQNHTFEFSTPASQEFFKIYGPGRALNFPGFYYTEQGDLTTQFPLAYIVWLALFFGLFGISGFAIANAVLMIIFFLSFYLLIRIFLKTPSALLMILFAATSFVFMWFPKFTLSENMALPLLWISILALMLFLKNPRKLYFIAFLAPIFLLAFSRIEGIAFLAVSILILYLNKNARNYIKERLSTRLVLPAAIFLSAFIANTIKDLNFYREIAKTLLSDLFTKSEIQYLGALTDIPLPAFYFEKIFLIYGMLGFFILGVIGILIHLYKKEFYKLIPFFIVLPTFIYFLNSQISPDHPWMLRRFMFSLLPVAIFYAGLLLGKILEKKNNKVARLTCSVVIVLLLAENLPAFSNYLFFSENKGLLQQIQAFGNKFSSDDLVLIDRGATNDGWSMISGPLNFLYGKNSAYFFNVQDLAKLDLQRFNNVYLIAPDQQTSYYLNSEIGNKLAIYDNYSFSFSKLNNRKEVPFEKVSLPIKETISVEGKIFKITK